MNKILAKLMLLLLLIPLLISPEAMAHEGHNHSHPYAWIAHLVWLISIVACGYISILLIRARFETKLRKMESDNVL
jgi:hypothetical protein